LIPRLQSRCCKFFSSYFRALKQGGLNADYSFFGIFLKDKVERFYTVFSRLDKAKELFGHNVCRMKDKRLVKVMMLDWSKVIYLAEDLYEDDPMTSQQYCGCTVPWTWRPPEVIREE